MRVTAAGGRGSIGAVSPKTLTGEELELDDAPARDCDLFLVDGNNLAYRAFFALPGGARDLRRRADRRAARVHEHALQAALRLPAEGASRSRGTRGPCTGQQLAEAADVVYKEGRKPMPDLLREQFPNFRPIVEAFGYRNLEFEGWEADDVIATLATRADEAGLRTCVVSTDRDAFQLCSENVCLMMTPRGVADVQVYTPERVEARYGVRPDQVPDFIGLKGDTSDNIPGVPGIGDKTAGAADRAVRLARGGDRARRRALAGALADDRRARRPGAASRRSSRRCAATSTSTSTRPSSCSPRPTARS